MSESLDVGASSTHVKLGGATPILRVADLGVSIAYYLAQLGFELQWRSDSVACVRRDRASLMLAEGDQGQSGTWIWIATSDVDQLYTEVEARGAGLRHAPANYPWGSRECQISDPDGHVLRFGSDLRDGEAMGDWIDGAGRRWLPEAGGGWRAAQ
jgi:predicted enzyme related to lactoylglutathione lyase